MTFGVTVDDVGVTVDDVGVTLSEHLEGDMAGSRRDDPRLSRAWNCHTGTEQD